MTKRRNAEKRADKAWSELIKALFNGGCFLCRIGAGVRGCSGECEDPHHLIKRANRATRWHPLNGVGLGRVCHNWAEEHPLKFMEIVRHRLPKQYGFYMAHKHDSKKYLTHEIKEKAQSLRQLKKEME